MPKRETGEIQCACTIVDQISHSFGGKAMLKEPDLHQLYQKFNLSKQAQQVIDEIRSSPPVRRVRSAAGNVSVRYPSRKMGVIIQAESHRNELAGIYEEGYDPDRKST